MNTKRSDWTTVALASAVHEELMRALGHLAFPRFKRVLAAGKKRLATRMESLRPKKVAPTPEDIIKDIEIESGKAYVEDMFSMPMSRLAIPLAALSFRDGCPHRLISSPWSFSSPPAALEHLAVDGFDSNDQFGIVASAPTRDDYWIVIRYSRCEIQRQWNRNHALQQEYPWISKLPDILERILGNTEITIEQTRAVPQLINNHDEATQFPASLAAEYQDKVFQHLSPYENMIWTAMRKAGGSQKKAFPFLAEKGVVKSLSTLCRRVAKIDEKLKPHVLPLCTFESQPDRFRRTEGPHDEWGEPGAEEIYAPDRDWADNPVTRDKAIRDYIQCTDSDKKYFHQNYFGIEDEAKAYKNRIGMKSN